MEKDNNGSSNIMQASSAVKFMAKEGCLESSAPRSGSSSASIADLFELSRSTFNIVKEVEVEKETQFAFIEKSKMKNYNEDDDGTESMFKHRVSYEYELSEVGLLFNKLNKAVCSRKKQMLSHKFDKETHVGPSGPNIKKLW